VNKPTKLTKHHRALALGSKLAQVPMWAEEGRRDLRLLYVREHVRGGSFYAFI
jgi:hypothetical protein